MEPMLAIFHDSEVRMMAFNKLIHCLPGDEMIFSGVQNGRWNIPSDGMLSDEAQVFP